MRRSLRHLPSLPRNRVLTMADVLEILRSYNSQHGGCDDFDGAIDRIAELIAAVDENARIRRGILRYTLSELRASTDRVAAALAAVKGDV